MGSVFDEIEMSDSQSSYPPLITLTAKFQIISVDMGQNNIVECVSRGELNIFGCNSTTANILQRRNSNLIIIPSTEAYPNEDRSSYLFQPYPNNIGHEVEERVILAELNDLLQALCNTPANYKIIAVNVTSLQAGHYTKQYTWTLHK